MININIKNKVASLSDPNMTAVCDNDYTIVFDFDEEWSSYANKTARFTFNDSYRDVVFSGDSVEMAYISNAPHVDIGVYAGDLCTTTPARLYMRRSIRSGTGAPADPEHDIYDQIMEQMTNVLDGAEEATERAESAQAAAETAESNAEIAEGNAESAQAAAEAAKSSVEATAAAFDTNAAAKTTAFNNNAATANANIDGKVAEVTADAATVASDKAATLVAKTAAETAKTNAETAQTAAETAEDNAAASATAAAVSAVSADYLPNTANALKRAISGTVVRMDDVSPLNHNLAFKQYGQCVQNGTPTPAAPIEVTGKVAGLNVGDGMEMTATQTVTDSNGDPVTLYGIPVITAGNVTINGQQYIADTLEGTTLTRRVGVADMGTLTWYVLTGRFGSDDISALIRTTSPSVACNALCNAFVPIVADDYNGTTGTMYVSTEGKIRVCDTRYTNANDFQSAMSGVMFYYILTTPTTETVTLVPATISANSPTTTVTAEAYTDTTYNRDAIKVIDELTAAIVALGGNI